MKLSFLVAFVPLVALGAHDASAAKWATMCPTPTEQLYPQAIGYVTSPFVHPGHDVTIRLDAGEVASSGGFSIAPDGNTVEVTMSPPGGSPLHLPTFTATAVSTATLHIRFPDAQALGGRAIAGPMRIIVRSGSTMVAETSSLIALPPTNDVSALAEGGGAVDVLAAMDGGGRLWIPVGFSGFGAMSKPNCPITLTPKTAFAVSMSFRRHDPSHYQFTTSQLLRKTQVYLGDFQVGDTNLYGTLIANTLDVKIRGGLTVCALNDALELVLVVPTRALASGRRSPLTVAVRDAAPIPLTLGQIAANDPTALPLPNLRQDSFGDPCVLRP